MASQSYTFDSPVGNKEDISPILTMISPDDSPLYSGWGRTPAKAMTHSWLTDSLRAAAANKHTEDAAYSVAITQPRVKLSNNVQIFMAGYFVTESQESTDKYAVESEIARQMTKAMKEIVQDAEKAIVEQTSTNAGDGVTPPELGGVGYFNTVNVVNAAAGALTEDMLNDAIQLAWEAGGNVDTVYCSGKNKRVISGWTAGATKNMSAGEKKVINVVNIYEADFGVVKIKPHRGYSNTRVDILESQYWAICPFKPFKINDLPKTGLRIEKNITGMFTVECRTKNAHAAITNLAA
jgi:hypothetical protein